MDRNTIIKNGKQTFEIEIDAMKKAMNSLGKSFAEAKVLQKQWRLYLPAKVELLLLAWVNLA